MATKLVDSTALSTALTAVSNKIKEWLSGKVDLGKQLIDQNQVPFVFAEFNDIIDQEENDEGDYVFPVIKFETASAPATAEIVYSVELRTFIARTVGSNPMLANNTKYYRTFPGIEQYCDSATGSLRRDVIFYCNQVYGVNGKTVDTIEFYNVRQDETGYCYIDTAYPFFSERYQLILRNINELSDAIQNVYTKQQADDKFAKKTDLQTHINQANLLFMKTTDYPVMTAAEATAAVNAAFS